MLGYFCIRRFFDGKDHTCLVHFWFLQCQTKKWVAWWISIDTHKWLILSCVIYFVWGVQRERTVKEKEACLDLVCLEHRHRYLLEWWIIHNRHGLGPVSCQYHLRSVIWNHFWLNNLARTTHFSLPMDTRLGNSWHEEQKPVNSLRLTLSHVCWGHIQDLWLPVYLILGIIWAGWNQQTPNTYEFKSSSF